MDLFLYVKPKVNFKNPFYYILQMGAKNNKLPQ